MIVYTLSDAICNYIKNKNIINLCSNNIINLLKELQIENIKFIVKESKAKYGDYKVFTCYLNNIHMMTISEVEYYSRSEEYIFTKEAVDYLKPICNKVLTHLINKLF